MSKTKAGEDEVRLTCDPPNCVFSPEDAFPWRQSAC